MSYNPKWLDQYASNVHAWRNGQHNGRTVHFRKLGIVESAFDIDGTHFEGRADLNSDLYFDLRTTLDGAGLLKKLLLAWAVLRQEHVLLSCSVAEGIQMSGDLDTDPTVRYFMYKPCRTKEEMLGEAAETTIFVKDHYSEPALKDFYTHLMNTTRAIDPAQSLSKLFVLPSTVSDDGLLRMHAIFVAAHQISDGITWSRWHASFIELLNKSDAELEGAACSLLDSNISSRLPPTQESIYPPIRGSMARRRWFWLISRILRHVRKPPAASFANPLRRTTASNQATRMPPNFDKVLDYSIVPPLNSFTIGCRLSTQATRRLTRVCRQIKISIGSGMFALIGMVMMEFTERLYPDIPLSERKPFVGSFPVNPRPFLAGVPTTGKEDSLMLAFSGGIALPFLSSDLPVEGRLKLLGRQAHRQLRQYQKRKRSLHEVAEMGTHSPDQLLPQLYMNTLEMVDSRIPGKRPRNWNIQGQYPPRTPTTRATCGISSVGDRTSLITPGKHDVEHIPSTKNLVADYRDMSSAVRVRDEEFLVAVMGDKDTIKIHASYDGCAYDPDLAEQWRRRLLNILEPDQSTQSAISAHL